MQIICCYKIKLIYKYDIILHHHHGDISKACFWQGMWLPPSLNTLLDIIVYIRNETKGHKDLERKTEGFYL